MNYYSRHIGDYLRDTSHLSLLEHGIYTRLLDVYYTTEKPLSNTGIARLIGAKTEEELAALDGVLMEFFIESNGTHTQPRCEREIEKYQDKAIKARASADARWSHTERNANAMPTHSEGNAPNNQEPITNKEKEKRPRKARATPLPQGFHFSERVKAWAGEKGYSGLDIVHQLEAFLSYAKRKGATYVDWDEALMTAIREDWAKVRNKPQDLARTTVPADPASFNRTREAPMTPEQREAADKARKLAMSALKVVAK